MRRIPFLLLTFLGCSPQGTTESPPPQTVTLPPPAQTVGTSAPGSTSDPHAHRRFSDLRRDDLGDGLRQESAGAAPSIGPPFDRRATAMALGSVDLAPCRADGGLRGSGHLVIVFASDGSVASTRVDAPPFEATTEGGCIAGLFARVHIPPFSGAPITVGKSFTL